jgi:hypothetical protein
MEAVKAQNWAVEPQGTNKKYIAYSKCQTLSCKCFSVRSNSGQCAFLWAPLYFHKFIHPGISYPGRLASRNSAASSESESYVTTDGQSATLSWNKAPLWGLRPRSKHSLSILGKACLRKLLDCCTRIRCRGIMFTESLPSNKRLLCFHYSGFRASFPNIVRSIRSKWIGLTGHLEWIGKNKCIHISGRKI